jgi:aminopeptidase N
VTASLPAFVSPGQDGLVRAYVTPALDSLPWVQRNRRIFFLGSWRDAMVGGQASPEALAAVDAFLAAHRALADELRRTVTVRRAFAR